TRAAATRELSRSFRAGHLFKLHEPRHLIGDLVFSPWAEVLPLTDLQSDALTKLDKLGDKSDDLSAITTADYLDTNPADYKEFLRRNELRRVTAFGAAQRMVAIGVLTKAQADFVAQRYLTEIDSYYTLGNAVIQPRLGFTEEQRARLAKVGEAANS